MRVSTFNVPCVCCVKACAFDSSAPGIVCERTHDKQSKIWCNLMNKAQGEQASA